MDPNINYYYYYYFKQEIKKNNNNKTDQNLNEMKRPWISNIDSYY